MEDNDKDKTLASDFLMKMYQEQRTQFRHYEVQRSTAATILTSLCAALAGLAGVLARPTGELGKGELPVTISIMLVSLLGFTLMWKLFERSRLAHSLSKAYLESLNETMAPILKDVIGGKTSDLPYVANARRNYVDAAPRLKPFHIVYPQGSRDYLEFDSSRFSKMLESHNPVYPQQVVYPVHNASMRFSSKYLSTWWLWQSVFTMFFFVGVYLSFDAFT